MSKRIAFGIGLILIRLIYLGFPNLFPEEAYYWNYAMHLDIGYLDHPPMVAWLIHLGTALFGNTEFGVRIFAFLCSLVSAFFIYRLTSLLYDRAAARTSFLILQVLPVFFLTGFMMTPDAPLIACWSGMLYYLACALFIGSPRAWIGAGICLGIGLVSKYTILLLVPATVVFLVLDPASRFWFGRFAPWLAGIIAAVLFSPVLVWNARHQWISFAFQTTDRIGAQREFGTHLLLASIFVLLTPVGVFLAVQILFPKLLTIRKADSGASRRLLFARVFTFVPLAVFVLFSLTHRVKLNWTGPLWLALIPALAATLDALPTEGRLRLRRASFITVGAVTALYIVFFQYLTTGLPGAPYVQQVELVPVGWKELGHDMDLKMAEMKIRSKSPVLVVGMDRNFIASELAFYQHDQAAAVRDTTGKHLFGGNSLMYKYWFPAARQEGATLLLVGFKKSDLEGEEIPKQSDPTGPVQEHWLERGGKIIRPYYIQVVSNYRSEAK